MSDFIKARITTLDERGHWKTIHHGVVLNDSGSMVKVYNHHTDTGPSRAEWFAKDAVRTKAIFS